MIKVHVPLPGKEYEIIIKQNLLEDIDQYIDKSSELVVISDDNIPKQYITKINQKLNNPLNLFIPEGESSKSMETANLLANKLIDNKITRGVTIIALGGGVVGDLAGFVASIYMRGVKYIQIPTTLLSQIDSSVGGKVGVNANAMKNAIGAFKQPEKVLIDPTVLNTLEQRHISNGIAEMIKYGLIASKPLFNNLLEKDVMANIDEYIYECVSIKKEIVLEDEFDYGRRQILNFGHTIGHALEQYSQYDLLHGEAVAIGMVMMSKKSTFYNKLVKVLQKYNLPTSYDYDKDSIYKYITTDKKANKNQLNIILVEEEGNGFIKTINTNDILERL